MKILTGTPQQIEDFLQELVAMAKVIFPQLGRTIDGEFLVNMRDGKDHTTKGTLRWDIPKYDEAQNLHYISNIMYVAGYDPEYLEQIQAKLDASGLVAVDDFQPTQTEEF